MTTMNPVDLYHDPTLDPVVAPQRNVYREGSSRRNGGQNRRSASGGSQMSAQPQLPPAPDVPIGPPISFRGPSAGADPSLQRSFSQRARNRPFAEEAFAVYDEVTEPRRPQPEQSATSKISEPLRVDTSAVQNRRQELIREKIKSAAAEDSAARDRRVRSDGTAYLTSPATNPPSAVTRSSTLRDAANQTEESPREWAPDRSPLQKLEVTLHDISKEEKRARVQEAEMLLREKSRSKKPTSHPHGEASRSRHSTSRREPPQMVADAETIEDAGIVRSLSSAQRDRLQHSTTIDSQKPDTQRLSAEKRGFDYERNNAPVTSGPLGGSGRTDPVAQRRHQRTSSVSQRVSSAPQSVPGGTRSVATDDAAAADGVVDGRDARDPAATSRSASLHNRQVPSRVRDEDRIPTAQERNASHRAALEQLTGTGAAARNAARTANQKSLRAPPADFPSNAPVVDIDTPATGARDLDGPHAHPLKSAPAKTLAPAVDLRASTPQRDPQPTGLGLQQSPALRSVDSPMANDTPRQKQRKSSVSFKEPFDRRRPVDEWREAGTARLSTADFDTAPVKESGPYKAWWEQDSAQRKGVARSGTQPTSLDAVIDDRSAEFKPPLYLKCGPLLRYTGMKRMTPTGGVEEKEYWRGSVMIVTQDSRSAYQESPTLRLFARPRKLLPPLENLVSGEALPPEHVDPIAGLTKLSRGGAALYIRPVDHLEEEKDLSTIETDGGLFESSPSSLETSDMEGQSMAEINRRAAGQDGEHFGRFQEVRGARLYADPDRDVTFWRFNLEIELGAEQQHVAYRINRGAAVGFWVPARGQTMNMMFHSCNGFSLSVKSDAFSGPDPLWRDVLNSHQTRPFHVMIGGGDQIYNDRAMTETQHFGEWTRNKNAHYKHHAPFSNEMKEELETFYLERYAKWFSSGLFAAANSQIPMVNIWDDHDIIDGFGSYPDAFMRAPVFSGIGNVAFKYYMLFQHQSVEAETMADEPSWVLGYKPGPYIKQLSRSVFLELGKHVAFLGLDCRTERMRNQVISLDTTDVALDRCRKEIVEGQTKHLIVLLGVPIAYPRLNWLENVLTSKAMDPIKAMGRAGMLKGGLLNKFDGGVEILDDLDDHWTANHHKEERNEFIKELQDLAAERSVRVTILGGDVHLAAIGQFYSNPKLKIPKDRDHRYMPNIISSAIVNTPPPEMMADILNKRNKIHHLDRYTDEDMIPMFTHDVDMKKRNNERLLPRRNWCSISEYVPGATPPSSRSTSPSLSDSTHSEDNLPETVEPPKRRFSLSGEGSGPRSLLRRLSSRQAPPSSYRDNEERGSGNLRSASFDGTTPAPNGKESFNSAPRASSETRASNTRFGHGPSSADQVNSRTRPTPRPGFQRRPTNLSEKAAKKGNVPALDADGNEYDINDHVNLEGGLDIVINCEVNQKDPAGITAPYRLLVPALWYDGSSDREKLEEAEGVQRRPTLMNKFGLKGRAQNKGTQSQGAGYWGKDESEGDSVTGSEGEAEQQPKKKFGLFGGSKKNRDKDSHHDDQHHAHQREKAVPQPGDTQVRAGPHFVPGRADASSDLNQAQSRESRSAFQRPPEQQPQRKTISTSSISAPIGPVHLNASTSTDQRFSDAARSNSTLRLTGPSQTSQRSVPQVSTSSRPLEPVILAPPATDNSASRKSSRPRSYVIGSSQRSISAGDVTPTSSFRHTPHDADSTYTSQQQQRSVSYAAAPPSSFPTQTFSPVPQQQQHHKHQRHQPTQSFGASLSSTQSLNSSGSVQRTLSKQERILGIGSERDSGFVVDNPQQRQKQLRGNGILGRFNSSSSSHARSNSQSRGPSSFNPFSRLSRSNSHSKPNDSDTGAGVGAGAGMGGPAAGDDHHRHGHGASSEVHDSHKPDRQGPGSGDEQGQVQGYSGIEAYREKPRRRWSIRDKARGLFDKFEGRRYDDDEYSDEYSDEYYSDDVEDEEGHENTNANANGKAHGGAGHRAGVGVGQHPTGAGASVGEAGHRSQGPTTGGVEYQQRQNPGRSHSFRRGY